MYTIRYLLFYILWCSSNLLTAQVAGTRIDRVVAVVGTQIVKESEIESTILQYEDAGVKMSDSLRGAVFEELMFKKLLLAQAIHDSLDVSESEIQQDMDRRMRYYLMQFGSTEAFEKFYGKSVEAFKFELHDRVKEQLLAQRMQGKIVQNVTVSPADVRLNYNSTPQDSLPFISSSVEIGQIVVKPPVNLELKEYTKQELEKIRERIIRKELDFCAAATLYSQDPGSANKCGTYENIRRGSFVPEFEALMFKLNDGEFSEVFETDFGYHFLQVISRRGDEVTVRHILRVIPTDPSDLRACKYKLDSIATLIRNDSLTFCEAAAKYSDDVDSKYSCGLILNPETGNSRIEVDRLGELDPDPNFPVYVNQMKTDAISAPMQALTRDSKEAWRLLWLKSRSEPHRANLKDDYQLIQEMTLQQKQDKVLNTWVDKKLNTTYIRIADDYKGYAFRYPWLQYIK